MTFRLTLCAAALVVAAGCSDSASTGGSADLDQEFGASNPFETLAYDSGYQLGQQIAQQDSLFSLDLFEEGFADGLAGDSARIAYALGLQYGLSLAADTVSNVPPAFFLASFREGFNGDSSRVTPARVQAAQSAARDTIMLRDLRARAATDTSAASQLAAIEAGSAEAETFLSGLSDVETTASGLKYTVTEEGEGASPSAGDRVRVDYVGTLPDGTQFDAGEGAEFNVSGVVDGFAEALQNMKPGGRRTVYIPPNLGYGLQGQGQIPPNSALVFDITLLEVLPPAPAGMGGAGGLTPEQLQQMMQMQQGQ